MTEPTGEQRERVNPDEMPLFMGPTLGDLQDIVEDAMSRVLYLDGLDQLPTITMTLRSITNNLADIANNLADLVDYIKDNERAPL